MTAVPQEKAAQLDAIEESGWGQPYRFLQPHNVAFWVYVVGVGAGAITMLRVFGPGAQFYTPALAGGVVVEVVPGHGATLPTIRASRSPPRW